MYYFYFYLSIRDDNVPRFDYRTLYSIDSQLFAPHDIRLASKKKIYLVILINKRKQINSAITSMLCYVTAMFIT